MRKFLRVISHEKPKLKEIKYNTLYIRTNLRKELDSELDEIYVYEEIQYEGNEIIEYIDNKQIESEQLITDLELNQLQTEQFLTEMDLKILELERSK